MSHCSELNSILTLGHPGLKQLAHAVSLPLDSETSTLIDDLMTLMLRDNGVGIAAPQVGRSQQVIIIASRPNLRYPNAPKMSPLAMINPKILSYSSETVQGWEGCLSVPGLRGHIERSQSVVVQYHDRHSQTHQETFHGFIARIIQHEYDHLMGKLFLDHVQSTEQLMSETEYFRQVL